MSVVTATITSDNAPMPPEYELLSLQVVSEVNRVPWATLALLDGDPAKQSFAISDGDFFEPGRKIAIKLRYEDAPSKEATVFTGLVLRHAIEARSDGCLLTLELKDPAFTMTRSRHSQVFTGKTDSQIIQILADKYGLGTGSIAPTTAAHPEIPQYYCSDWDFMLARAEANGMLIASHNGAISMANIVLDQAAKQTFTFGASEIYNFEMEIDARQQYANIQGVAWDPVKQSLSDPVDAAPFALPGAKPAPNSVAEKTGGSLQVLSDIVPQEPAILKARVDAAMSNSRMSMQRGRIGLPGQAQIKCLDLIAVAGVGARFNGARLVTGVTHRVDVQGWRTDLQFGLSAASATARLDVMDRPAGGQLPGVNGLQIGQVTSYDDPDKLSRIRVKLPLMAAEAAEVWARLASPDAGKGRGMVFRPEPGDEVVVGFFNDDPRQAVILGAMFSSGNAQPADFGAPDSDNNVKGFLTRSGIALAFIDEPDKSVMFIETPQHNKILLDDENRLVNLSDQHGNGITMSEKGIEITCAKGKIAIINNDADIEISTGKGNVEISGSKVNIK
jgi:Rhs element Vgr protein